MQLPHKKASWTVREWVQHAQKNIKWSSERLPHLMHHSTAKLLTTTNDSNYLVLENNAKVQSNEVGTQDSWPDMFCRRSENDCF